MESEDGRIVWFWNDFCFRQTVKTVFTQSLRYNGNTTSKLIAFGWYGGKYSHLDWLLPHLPEATHFCDVFGGSAAVLINRPPALVETYNDVDSELVTHLTRS